MFHSTSTLCRSIQGTILPVITLGCGVLVAGCASDGTWETGAERDDRDYAYVRLDNNSYAQPSHDRYEPPAPKPEVPAGALVTSADSPEQASLIAESGLAAEVTAPDKTRASFDEHTLLSEAEEFFGEGAEGLAEVMHKVFNDQGAPDAYIMGSEGGGAFVVGLRYGEGTFHGVDGTTREIYWKGPSIGLDAGGNAAKAFVLIYGVKDVERLYQRFPGVEGSVYFVGGVGVNYNVAGDITLAPIRFGIGWRQGINIGYLDLRKDKSIFLF